MAFQLVVAEFVRRLDAEGYALVVLTAKADEHMAVAGRVLHELEAELPPLRPAW
jgi:hypothetical protein